MHHDHALASSHSVPRCKLLTGARLALGALLVVALAACGGGGGDSSSSGSGGSGGGGGGGGGPGSSGAQTYTVSPTVSGTGGSISPSATVTVNPGATASFTLSPSPGYTVSSVGGTCGGTRNNNSYTTNAITGNCTVVATFVATGSPTYTVTPTVSGTGGSISPSTTVTVNSGATASFTLSPSPGYTVSSVGGTCSGTRTNNSYTTNAVTGNCTVVATFVATSSPTYTVTSTGSGTGGTITPSTVTVQSGGTTTFTVTPGTGYTASVTGCGGSLSGTAYTTGAITGNCTVAATFTSYVVSTVAGLGPNNAGAANGAASVATFSQPSGVATGPNGSLYVADWGNSMIRMIAANGTVSTVAGVGSTPPAGGNSAGSPTYGDGPCASAFFFNIFDVAADANGNLYVADATAVRKITNPGTASCTVSTLAGSTSVAGNADGTGTSARFQYPIFQLKLDAGGNVYVADEANNSVRKITSAGVVTTVAASTQFGRPLGLAVDQGGNLYVGSWAYNNIHKITPAGVVSVFAGSPAGASGYTDGPAASALFTQIDGLAFGPDGTLYVSDLNNNAVRRISPSGQVTTLAGMGSPGFVNGPAGLAKFNAPEGLAVDASGAIYVADTNNNAIRKIAPQ